ncbi:MAG: 16S rRNA (cytosine(967)-C(5))-methyltransferase RsmB [Solirubrobacterales bacterium]|nr:MAG: 16S rRNA (cytosine(967)-C(5))-methyltransferase RsmB [Solirubrobacterales bacterium]
MSAVSPARTCAFAVIRRVFEHGAYADRAMHAEAAGLAPRERAFAMALAYGTVQRRATLDHVAARLCSRPLPELEPPVLAALRVGLLQLLFLDGVAEHAAVNESVELAKLANGPGRRGPGRGGAPLVNAVLRRAIREGRGILDALDDRTPEQAALMHSLPVWLAERWWRELGADRARALMGVLNQPAESALRVNTLRSTIGDVRARLPVPARPAPGLPEGLVLEAPFDAHASALFETGAIMPQSRGSMLVARVLDPRPGDRVLDLCAAPGAKTTQLAALMQDAGEVVAVERHRGRAEALGRTCRRMGASCVRVECRDALSVRAHGLYDRVLVDPPCSGLGTLQARPDLRWRVVPGTVAELAALQRRILAVAGEATAPAGVLAYSLCTISRQEGEEVVRWFLRTHPEFVADDLGAVHPDWSEPSFRSGLQLLPDRDGTDGFFIARLRRTGS